VLEQLQAKMARKHSTPSVGNQISSITKPTTSASSNTTQMFNYNAAIYFCTKAHYYFGSLLRQDPETTRRSL
jgi:hypothetical protein